MQQNMSLIYGTSIEIIQKKKAEQALIIYASQLEKNNRELDNYTYSISHDLKEPLRSLHSYANFIEKDYLNVLDTQGKQYISRIKLNADYMKRLIEDLLDIAHLDKIRNLFSMVDVQMIIKETFKSGGVL